MTGGGTFAAWSARALAVLIALAIAFPGLAGASRMSTSRQLDGKASASVASLVLQQSTEVASQHDNDQELWVEKDAAGAPQARLRSKNAHSYHRWIIPPAIGPPGNAAHHDYHARAPPRI